MSHALLQDPATDPTSIYRARDGIYAVDLLTAAIAHLDLFTWLAEHPSTTGAICAHFGLHQRPADVLLTLTRALGLTTSAGGVEHLTLRAREHLVASSPWYIAPYYAALKDRPQTLDMLKVLRTGKPANWGSYDAVEWARAMERPEFAEQFTSAMNCRGVYLGRALAQKVSLQESRRLLDIGGGSGIYACSLASHYPEMRATVYEKAPVEKIAARTIERYGLSDRISAVSGDMFREELPKGYDVHLISNVLHDWDEPQVRQILESSWEALEPGGLLLIHDAHINAEKNGPLPVAQYSVLLMHSTEGKCYSQGEMKAYLGDLGFEWVAFHETAADRSCIVARRS